MKYSIKLIYGLSNSLWLISISLYLSILLSDNQNLTKVRLDTYDIGFVIISTVLIIIELLSCYALIFNQFDLQRLLIRSRPHEENILSKQKTQKLLLIFKNLSNALIYGVILLNIIYPHKGLHPFLTFGLFPKAFYFFITAFIPQTEYTD